MIPLRAGQVWIVKSSDKSVMRALRIDAIEDDIAVNTITETDFPHILTSLSKQHRNSYDFLQELLNSHYRLKSRPGLLYFRRK